MLSFKCESKLNWSFNKTLCLKIILLPIILFFLLTQNAKTNGNYDSFAEKHRNYFSLSRSYLTSDLKKAAEYSILAFQYAEKTGQDLLIGQSYYLLGIIDYFNGKYDNSSANYLSAIHYLAELDNEQALQLLENSWNNLGVIYDLLNLISNSAHAYKKSIEYANLQNNSYGLNQTRINLALINIRLGLYEEASKSLEQALNYFEPLNDTHHLGLIHHNLGLLNMHKNDLDAGLSHLDTAIGFYNQNPHNFYIKVLYADILRIKLNTGDFEGLTEIVSLLKEDFEYDIHNMRDIGFMILFGLYEKIKNNNMELALFYLEEAYEGIKISNEFKHSDLLYLNLAEIYAINGEKIKFREMLKKYKHSRDIIREEELTANRYISFINEFERIGIEHRVFRHDKFKFYKQYAFYTLILFALFMVVALFIRYQKNSANGVTQDTRKDDAEFKTPIYSPELGLSNLKIPHVNTYSVQQSENADFFTDSIHLDDFDSENLQDKRKPEQLFSEIKELIEKEKLYANSSLTLSEISYKLGSNDKYVSVAINTYYGQSFTNLINSYRIQCAKNLLLKYGENAPNKLICSKCGFGSISTFHRVFKNATGYAPNEWVSITLKQTA
jgi:AraC-like DNA-binding protein